MGSTTRSLLFATALALTPALAGADLSGSWDVVWNTEGGIRNSEWKVTQEGSTLKIDSDGNPLTGTTDGTTLSVEGKFYAAEAGYSSTLKIEGKLEDGKLSGRATWDVYAMTFTATRSD